MHGFFYGWYFKCQSDTQTLAVIPAVHNAGSRRACSIQMITDDDAWTVTFSADEFQRSGRKILIGENRFGEKGIQMDISTPQLTVRGKVSVNGREYSFRNAQGYWEGDQGRSFPEKYIWTQCFFSGGSLMLSVADIPMAGFHFTGITGVILWRGKEYRIATYLGARVIRIQNGMVRVIQGNLELDVRLIKASARSLRAPANGDMVRTIRESAACQAFYRFRKKGRTLFAFETDRASFESEYFS